MFQGLHCDERHLRWFDRGVEQRGGIQVPGASETQNKRVFFTGMMLMV